MAMNTVTFGGFPSFKELHLILNNKTIGQATPKKTSVSIPGGNGELDLTEYFGETKYDNRTLSFSVTSNVPQSNFLEHFTYIQNLLHGQKTKIILSDDPLFYYVGRINISDWKAKKNVGQFVIDADCEPFKYFLYVTRREILIEEETIICLTNSRMRVIPLVSVDSAMSIVFGNTTYELPEAGSYKLSGLALSEGNNLMTVTGNGLMTISYQEGDL